MVRQEMKMLPVRTGPEIKLDEVREVNSQCIRDIIDSIRKIIPIPDSLLPSNPNDSENDEPENDGSENDESLNVNQLFTQIVPLGVVAVGAPTFWHRGLNGDGVLIGVIDSGIMDHPDLLRRVSIRRNYTREFFKPLAVHGTHVAGIIAAEGTILGVAPGAKLADYRVLSSVGTGSSDAVIKAVHDAVKDGCHIINMSLGGPSNDPRLETAINYAHQRGVTVIVAAGNEGDGNDQTIEISYPGIYDNVICVGSVNYNLGSTPSHFTNTSPYVDCCSHGERVISTGSKGGYVELSGTSMACPHVAGVAALLVQEAVRAGEDPTPQLIRQRLMSYAKDVHLPGFDYATGNGFITLN